MNILTINRGSSSLKFTLFDMREDETVLISGNIEELGSAAAVFQVKNGAGKIILKKILKNKGSLETVRIFLDWIKVQISNNKPDVVAHRIVHGGLKQNQPCVVTPEILGNLKKLVPFATEHLPVEIEVIIAVGEIFPDILQIACFDTAFHGDKPYIAKMTPLPANLLKEGVLRYGFHGLSYEFITRELKEKYGSKIAGGRVIIAHLGNGSSMAAVKEGKCVDTTMGFTPSGGLMMGTRCGDIDPGLLFYLLEQKAVPVKEVKNILNKKSGLLGVSGTSSDMQSLLKIERKNSSAKEAVELYCYTAKKFIGALSSTLGGLDTLVFTAGIGENAPPVRERICRNMEFLGIYLDHEKNLKNENIISARKSPVAVMVIKTNEALMIARHAKKLLKKS